MAATLGFSNTTLTIIATAISEVARNIVEYAKEGEISHRAGRQRHGARTADRRARSRARASSISRRRCATATRRARASAWDCPAPSG